MEKAEATAARAADGLIEEDGWVIVGRAGQRIRRPVPRPVQGPVGPRAVPGGRPVSEAGPVEGVHPNARGAVRP
jgi:hypothetical protein